MSETLERWKLVTEGFTQRLHAVEEGQWEKATPCTAFTVRQLIEHVIDVQRMGPRLLGASGAIDTPRAAISLASGRVCTPPHSRHTRQRGRWNTLWTHRLARCLRSNGWPGRRLAMRLFTHGIWRGPLALMKPYPKQLAPYSFRVLKPYPRTFCANRGFSKRPSLHRRGPMRKRNSSVILAASLNLPRVSRPAGGTAFDRDTFPGVYARPW